MNDTYRDPLLSTDVNINNLDKWKKRLSDVKRIPDSYLLELDIKNIPSDINKKKELYFEKSKFTKEPYIYQQV